MIDKYNQYLAVQMDDFIQGTPIIYKSGYKLLKQEIDWSYYTATPPPKKCRL